MISNKLDTININGFVVVFETTSKGLGNMELLHEEIGDCRATIDNAYFWNETRPASHCELRCPGRAYEKAMDERQRQKKRQRIIKEILAEQAEARRLRLLKVDNDVCKSTSKKSSSNNNGLGARAAKVMQEAVNKPYRTLKRRRQASIAVYDDLSVATSTQLELGSQLAI